MTGFVVQGHISVGIKSLVISAGIIKSNLMLFNGIIIIFIGYRSLNAILAVYLQ